MNHLYLLIHTYEFCDGTEIKLLGIYSTREKAKEAKARFYALEGFNKYPESCFFQNPANIFLLLHHKQIRQYYHFYELPCGRE